MSALQWALLVGTSMIVLGLYLYLRRLRDDDPWKGIDRDDTHDEHLTATPVDNWDEPIPFELRREIGDLPNSADDEPILPLDDEPERIRAQARSSRPARHPAPAERIEKTAAVESDSLGSDIETGMSAADPAHSADASDEFLSEPLIDEIEQGIEQLVDIEEDSVAASVARPQVEVIKTPPVRPEPKSEAGHGRTTRNPFFRTRSAPEADESEPDSVNEDSASDGWDNFTTDNRTTDSRTTGNRSEETSRGNHRKSAEQLGLDIKVDDDSRTDRITDVPPGEEKIVVLHIRARDGKRFTGTALHNALQLCRLKFGMRDIYHRITEVGGVPESVFSVANMLKPGYLDPQQAEGFETLGVTLFMVLPGPIDGVTAFRDMLNTADKIALRLGGEVLDESRNLITHQTAQYIRDEIAETERRWRVNQRKK